MEELRKEIERKKKLASGVRLATGVKLGQGSSSSFTFLRRTDIVDREQELKRSSQEHLDANRALTKQTQSFGKEKVEETAAKVVDTSVNGTEEHGGKGSGSGSGSEEGEKRKQQLTIKRKSHNMSGNASSVSDVSDSERERTRKTSRSTRVSSSGGDSEDKDADEDEDEEEKEKEVHDHASSSSFSRYQPGPKGCLPRTDFSHKISWAREKIVRKYFKLLLQAWNYDLSQRDSTVRDTANGKREDSTYIQCVEHIQPLFRLCKNRDVPGDILEQLIAIVACCESGNFKEANDHYLQAAIGNAPWPIGVNNVGIHQRAGRESISSANVSQVANVMNNELQRKYFTSIKRLITFAQNKRKDVGPSLKVM